MLSNIHDPHMTLTHDPHMTLTHDPHRTLTMTINGLDYIHYIVCGVYIIMLQLQAFVK